MWAVGCVVHVPRLCCRSLSHLEHPAPSCSFVLDSNPAHAHAQPADANNLLRCIPCSTRQVFDENLSPYLLENMKRAGIDVATVDLADDDFMESNMRHSINGWMYCNMPPVVVPQGARVRWVMIDFGGATALHSPYLISQVCDGWIPCGVSGACKREGRERQTCMQGTRHPSCT